MKAMAAPVPGMRRKAWIPFVFALAPINLILSVDRNAFVMVSSVIQREYGFDLERMSYILASISWTYAIFQLPSGWLIQRFGFRRLLAIALVGWSLAIGLMPIASGFWSLLALRLLLGAAQAPDWPSSVAAISRWFPPERRSRFTSIALSGQYIGPVIGSIVTGGLAFRYGWRPVFYGYAIIGVGLCGIWWWLTRDQTAATAASAQQERDPAGVWPELRALLAIRATWVISSFYFCLISVQAFFLSWLPIYLTRERSVTLTASGWYTAMPWLTLYVSVTAYGFYADSVLRKGGSLRLARLPAAVLGLSMGAISLALVPWIADLRLVIVTLCFSLFGVGMVQGVVWSTVQDMGGSRTPLLAGWTSFWGNLSAGIFPIVMGYLVKWTGDWKYALFAPVVFSALGVVLAFLVPFPITPRKAGGPELGSVELEPASQAGAVSDR